MTTDLTNPTHEFTIDDFHFTPTGFSGSPKAIKFEQWQRIGEFIRLTNAASQWWWGDWLNLGEDTFGEKSSQALEITKWDETTLRVYAWVCRNVPLDRRLTGVPFSHYMLLAKLPEAQQRRWALRALDEQWSQRQLRRALRDSKDDAVKMQPCLLMRFKNKDKQVEAELWANMHNVDFERCERAKK